MRMRVLFSLLVSLLSGLLIAFSVEPINASAVSGGRWLTTSECVDIFGASFDVTYFNGNDYVTTTASYTDGTRTLQSAAGAIPSGIECLQYTAPVVDLSLNPQYITCDIRPQYSVFGTSQIHTALFAYCVYNSVAVPPYQTPDWRWLVSGSEQLFTGNVTNGVMDSIYVGSDQCIYINVDIDSQSTFTASSVRATFVAPLSVYNGKLYFYLAPVYVSTSADASNGTATTTSSGGGSGSPDMSQTNGILSGISDLISGIPAAIAHIFIPTSDELTDWRESIAELLNDTFGDVPALHDQLETAIGNIIGVSATESITFPGVSPPGVGQVIAPQSVPLRPSGFDSLFTMLRLAVDIIATIAVFNMLQDKVKAFLVGETVVDKVGD